MKIKDICPCPNQDCPNHGFCDRCISRHLKAGNLNFCGFQTILPALQDAIKASPESLTAQKLTSLIENKQLSYAKLMEKHKISQEEQKIKIDQIAEYSNISL